MTTAQRIEHTLRQALDASEVHVKDEGAQHAGHAGAAAGGGHYHVTVVSSRFEGKTQVQQHRLVYGALGDAMGSSIHALALTTRAPSRDTDVE